MLRSFTATVTTSNSKFGWGDVYCYAFDMNGHFLGGVTPKGYIFVGDKSTQPTQTFTINTYISGAYYWLIALAAWGGGVSATATIKVSDATWNCYNNQVRVVGGTYSAGLPNITGGIYINAPAAPIAGYPSNAFTQGAQINRLGGDQGKTSHQILFSAHDSNQLYGSDNTVVPESLGTQFCIKY